MAKDRSARKQASPRASRVIALLALAFGVGCDAKKPASQCESGWVDVDGACRELCLAACPSGLVCERGVCVECETDPCEPPPVEGGSCTGVDECTDYPNGGEASCYTVSCTNALCLYTVKPIGATCTATTCEADTVTFGTTCDTAGTCVSPTPASQSCGGTGCDPAASTCTDVSDCCLDEISTTPGFNVDPTSMTNTAADTAPTFTVSLTAPPLDAVSISLTSSNPNKATPSPALLQFTTGNWSTPQTVTVTPQEDGYLDIDNQVTITTSAATSTDPAYAGMDPPNVTVTNIDADKLEVISVSTSGTRGNGASSSTSVSNDGRFVAFLSSASNLVDGDTNAAADIFLRDRQEGTTVRVSVTSTGGELTPNFWGTGSFALSGNGKCVVFSTDANGVVSGDNDSALDLFLRDLENGTTEQINVNSSEIVGDDTGDLFADPQISADCNYVVFASSATNLVASDTNAVMDIFVRNRPAGTTERVSVSTSGTQSDASSSFGLSISDDGRYVAFSSGATNLVTGDTNAASDIFLRDRLSSTTTRISVSSAEAEADKGSSLGLRISGSGNYLAFLSGATNLVSGDENAKSDIFVRDLVLGTTAIASLSAAGEAHSADVYVPRIDSSGRYVLFTSNAATLVASDNNNVVDVFLRDMQASTTLRVSVASDGSEANAKSGDPSLSADGRWIVFSSEATNLVAADTNGVSDIFLVRRP